MAVTASRSITVQFTGDIQAANTFAAANNVTSPGQIEIKTLAAGANTITPPAGSKSVTIIPPAANTNVITLKGIAGDTGVALHLTDPANISLNAAAAFVLNAAAEIIGVRFVWT